MISIKKQLLISLFYFFIAANLGLILRFFPVININGTYKYLVHTHSHIALLGWVYVALTSFLFYLFIKKEVAKRYAVIFWCTQITLLGMLASFPITGYALFSIIFSTLFLICSYWFFLFFRKNNTCNKASYSYKFINISLIFMVFSSIGPWTLGIIMNTLGNTSHWYKNAIYFYLHFQYNGWFIFCLLGIFFFLLEKKKIQIHKELISPFYRYMIISCFLTLFLSFLWVKPTKFIYLLAGLGSVYQLIALGKLYLIISNYKDSIYKIFTPSTFLILRFVFLLFTLKVLFQFLTAIPYFAELVSHIKDFVIGYLHLVFLGIISLSILFLGQHQKLIKINKTGIIFFLTGFIFSEILIFYKGFCNWQQLSLISNYYSSISIASTFMPIGILIIFIYNMSYYISKIKWFNTLFS